jgi:hypothetical protein
VEVEVDEEAATNQVWQDVESSMRIEGSRSPKAQSPGSAFPSFPPLPMRNSRPGPTDHTSSSRQSSFCICRRRRLFSPAILPSVLTLLTLSLSGPALPSPLY